ncbi:hypothetical protein GCM10023191_024880 [Actinoallomurus oryzae]|uniref:Uncharacterized protein n=1 Tax=Actinoallomurus oryzae TaxID=502180 RepID=A0ABP8PTY8_9ACTN
MGVTGGVPNEIARYSYLITRPADRLKRLHETVLSSVESAGDFYGSGDPTGKAFMLSFKPAVSGLGVSVDLVHKGMKNVAKMTIEVAQHLYIAEENSKNQAVQLGRQVPSGGKGPHGGDRH